MASLLSAVATASTVVTAPSVVTAPADLCVRPGVGKQRGALLDLLLDFEIEPALELLCRPQSRENLTGDLAYDPGNGAYLTLFLTKRCERGRRLTWRLSGRLAGILHPMEASDERRELGLPQQGIATLSSRCCTFPG